jgi:hypothetical protein
VTLQPQPGQPPVGGGLIGGIVGSSVGSINIVTQAGNPEQMARIGDQLVETQRIVQESAASTAASNVETQRIVQESAGSSTASNVETQRIVQQSAASIGASNDETQRVAQESAASCAASNDKTHRAVKDSAAKTERQYIHLSGKLSVDHAETMDAFGEMYRDNDELKAGQGKLEEVVKKNRKKMTDAVNQEGAQNRARLQEVMEGQEAQNRARHQEVRGILTAPPVPREVLAREERKAFLKSRYEHLFALAADGELVPLKVKPVVGDLIMVDKVPDGHPYKDKIGVWQGIGRQVEFDIGTENHKFNVRDVTVVLRK